MTFDDKSLFAVSSSSPSSAPTSVLFNRNSRGINNCTSAAALNANSSDLSMVNIVDDDDENEQMRDYETSNDTERLIH